MSITNDSIETRRDAAWYRLGVTHVTNRACVFGLILGSLGALMVAIFDIDGPGAVVTISVANVFGTAMISMWLDFRARITAKTVSVSIDSN